MKKLLIILITTPLIFHSCKKEEATIDPAPKINNLWQLSMQSTSLAHGDLYTHGVFIDSVTGMTYTGQINSISSGSIMVSNDTIFPGLSTSYSSRVWGINDTQLITDDYYDGNGVLYNTLVHEFTRISDTLVINFQSGDIKTFIINALTTDHFHIISIPETNLSPLVDINEIYQDTILMNITSDEYFFDIIE